MELQNSGDKISYLDSIMIEYSVSNSESTPQSPRVLFFGMQGSFSATALQCLLDCGIEVCAVVLPAPSSPGGKPLVIQRRQPSRALRSQLPLVHSLLPVSLMPIAWSRNIPVWEVERFAHPDTVAILAAYQPDIICVACFSRLIPRILLDLPRFGCLNVHPSLLPANRGPVPLFWTFRQGHRVAGVTIHFMEDRMDSGDILAQERIPLHDGITYNELEAQCALRGGSLLAQVVRDLYEGRARRHSQDEHKSSYYTFPEAEDFIVQVEAWDAQHVYNFIQGMSSWDEPISILLNNERFVVRRCISYSHKTRVKQPVRMQGEMLIPCRVGWVRVLLASSANVSV